MGFLNTRTNRATYWASAVLVAALYALLNVLLPTRSSVSEVVLVILCVPRLHDIGRTGWLVLAPLALEIAAAVGLFILPQDDGYVVFGVAVLIILGAMVWLGVIPGEPEANRFGDPPPPGVQFRRRPKKIDPTIASTFD